jgi:hypothetical protein
MKYVVIKSIDGKNIGKVFDSLPFVGQDILLDFGYIFEVVEIRKLDNIWEVSNPNYILFLEEKKEE